VRLKKRKVANARCWAGEDQVPVNTAVSRSTRSTVLERLRILRASLARARDTLMHFKGDRVDRDTLEPAARRVDGLMDMFASNSSDPLLVDLWSREIGAAIDKVSNPKSAEALLEASAELAAILGMIEAAEKVARV
jgi:hypothetical protein